MDNDELDEFDELKLIGMLGWIRKGACRNGSSNVFFDCFVLFFFFNFSWLLDFLLKELLSIEIIVDADEWFFSFESAHDEEAERLYVEEFDEEFSLEFDKLQLRSSDEDDDDLDEASLFCVFFELVAILFLCFKVLLRFLKIKFKVFIVYDLTQLA